MQDKLQILLEKINLPANFYHYFEDGKILKLLCNKEKTDVCFHLVLENVLSVDCFDYFKNNLPDAFPEMQKVSFNFCINNINDVLINEYYKYIISKSGLTKPMQTIFDSKELKLNDEKINIQVANKAEYNKLAKHLDEINELFVQAGFKQTFDIEINEREAIVYKEAIASNKEETKVVIKNEVNPVILGVEPKGKITVLKNIISEENEVTVEAKIFGIDLFESSKSNFKIITLKITDETDSIYAKVFTKEADEFNRLTKELKEGTWVKINGYVKNDQFAKDLVLNVRNIMLIAPKENKIIDDAEIKRVELHTHTHMSQMDGMVSAKDLIKQAKKWGHQAIAITDHNACQSFPEAYGEAKDIKVIYGAELSMVDDGIDIVFRESNLPLLESTYVVFDFETTGFNAGGGDVIIEVGAVKLENGKIVDKFSELINPGRKLPEVITKLTNITDQDLKDKDDEKTVLKRFIEWAGNLPMVAHNAKFDASFLENVYYKYDLGTYNNTLIDTLELSRALDPDAGRHGLTYLAKRYDVPWDETAHHRGDYDAEATALIFYKMCQKLVARQIKTIDTIKDLVPKEEAYKFGTLYHINLLVQNEVGLKNLFRIVSLANTDYLYKTPRILRSEIIKHKEGLLIGSSCYQSEVFTLARSKSDEELANVISFYDYVEIQPLDAYDHLLQMGDFESVNELKEHLKKIIRVSEITGKIVVATGDVHHLTEKDKISREIIINQKVPGGGRHPLNRQNINFIPSLHFRTTKEMLKGFDYLDENKAYELVVTNTNLIADRIEKVTIIKDKLYTPKMPNADTEVTEMVNKKAKEIYGDELPKIVQDRVTEELTSIIGNGFDVIYLIAQKLVKKSNDDGYLVGSRGSVGSSFAATMMGITEVNPLPPHYICPNCKTSVFEIDDVSLGSEYSSGYDLPDLTCKCGTPFKKEGQDMPFATFLGFKGDKVPDIDLNFSSEYQAKAHDYTKELFGDSFVFRAGTIGTVADKTAFGFVKGYLEEKNYTLRSAEIERLALGCVGVKRTTGQHPGGIIVIPDYMEIFDFSPYQYPADDAGSRWYTTHFDFHAIHDNILKLDILGHDDPTVLRMLGDLSGLDVQNIPFDDPKVYQIFSSPNVLGVDKESIMCETGTLGIPEFGTKFVIDMLKDTKPATFAELVKISGLSHGTDVWLGNAQDLIRNNICEFKDVIGCRDDIMVYLMYHGLEPSDAFKIMEFVRKGMPSKKPDDWMNWDKLMREKNINDWYIESCKKIKYMFPKAHATAYVMMAYRVAWFKVYHPILYYAAYFSCRAFDFDIESMIKGYANIKSKINEIITKGYDATQKETAVLEILELALEMSARGFKFANIDLYKSDATKFIIAEDGKTLIPPFRTLDGLGDTVAQKIVTEREIAPFVSIEDLQKRGKVSATIIDKMRTMKILDGMPESSQLSLF